MEMRERDYTLITGGAGFVGSNLADALLTKGERVLVLDNFSRPGVELNAAWLVRNHGSAVQIEVGDVADLSRVRTVMQDAWRVYHLAAQVAVTTSLHDPTLDMQSNVLGTFNVLETARSMSTPPSVLFTSTNKVYGELNGVPITHLENAYAYADRRGISEDTPLDFCSPYGCSKGAADQYVRDYGRIYGLPTAVLRMSCVYGTRQFGTEDQGWVAHFARALLAGSPITIFGDGWQVRDLLWVEDLVDAMQKASDRAEEVPGEVYNIGGGEENAVSVRTVIDRLTAISGSRVPLQMADWRPGDQRIYVSDTTKAQRFLGWRPTTHWTVGLEKMIDWLKSADLAMPALPRHRPERRAAPASAAL
jgi:CDP-paratose 2-epimerase